MHNAWCQHFCVVPRLIDSFSLPLPASHRIASRPGGPDCEPLWRDQLTTLHPGIQRSRAHMHTGGRMCVYERFFSPSLVHCETLRYSDGDRVGVRSKGNPMRDASQIGSSNQKQIHQDTSWARYRTHASSYGSSPLCVVVSVVILWLSASLSVDSIRFDCRRRSSQCRPAAVTLTTSRPATMSYHTTRLGCESNTYMDGCMCHVDSPF